MAGVAREVGMVVRGETRAHQLLRSRLMGLAMLTLVVDLIGTTLMWAFEHDAPGTSFTTWFGALFWTSAQLTTVSSQQANPVTPAGKAFDIVLQMWGITVTVTLAAAIVSFFVHRHFHEMKHDE